MPEIGAPCSWYPVALSAGVGAKPVPLRAFGADYVLFRTRAGEVAGQGEVIALARYCLHMGADLARARVVDGGLRCNLHGWVYTRDGSCAQAGSAAGAAGLKRLALHECGGVVHAWPGAEPAWPFPDLPGLPELPEFQFPRAAKPGVAKFACPMHAIGLNGFDIWHYGNVHRRQVRTARDAPVVTSNAAHHLGLAFTADVEPVSVYDKLLIRLGYGTLRVQLDYYGGNLIFVRNLSGGYLALLSMAPDGEDRCTVYVIAFTGDKGAALAQPVRRVLRLLFREIALYFLRADEPFLTGMHPREGLLVEGKDDVARAFWRWWRALPRIVVV